MGPWNTQGDQSHCSPYISISTLSLLFPSLSIENLWFIKSSRLKCYNSTLKGILHSLPEFWMAINCLLIRIGYYTVLLWPSLSVP